MPVTRRRTGLAALCALALLALAGCNGGDDAGSGPTPFEDDTSGTPTSPAPSSEPSTTEPTTPATSKPPAKKASVIVDPGTFGQSPAVIGLTRAIQEFYKARQAHNPGLMSGWVSTIFYTDNEAGIIQAKRQGLVMRPPGKIVVRAVRKGPIANSLTVDTCFGPTMAWYDPKKKKYTYDRPGGSPISMDMTNGGSAWQIYQARNGRFACNGVKYPAG